MFSDRVRRSGVSLYLVSGEDAFNLFPWLELRFKAESGDRTFLPSDSLPGRVGDSLVGDAGTNPISQRSNLDRLGRGGLEGTLDNIALADLGRSISGSSETDFMEGWGLLGSITSLRLAVGLGTDDS